MRIHFIAIGGSAMHNLALALCHKGYTVTGSDDEIFEPARSRLAAAGILPPDEGWHPSRITPDLDAVILGMHAHADNPELLRARELGLKIYSYPEYLYEQSRDKQRIVIGGSHGKTTTTAMILHVLRACGIEADYMVGAQLQGFDVMVRLSNTARVMVIEGDEYLTSPIDPRPKFHLYHPHVAILTGIEWDHVNVFPTFDNYRQQFETFVRLIEPQGTLIYCDDDPEVCHVVDTVSRGDIQKLPYNVPDHRVEEGRTILLHAGNAIPLQIFGRHNLLNLNAARLACRQVGVDDAQFYNAIATFGGAGMRLQRIAVGPSGEAYRDFAHAPSKLRATVQAVRQQFPERHLVACFELHTYSSLSSIFLPHYRDTMRDADTAIVYFNPHALQLKRLPPLDVDQVRQAFNHPNITVYTDIDAFCQYLRSTAEPNTNYLFMSSGNFNAIDVTALATQLLNP